MTIKRWAHLIVVTVLMLLATAGITAASGDDQPVQQPDFPPSGMPDLSTQGTATEESTAIAALGSVEAANVVTLYFRTAGTVDGVYVQLGDTVNAGEVVADLDATDAWNTYNRALLNLENAQLSLDALDDPPTDEDIRVAKANIASAQAAYSSAANGSTGDLETAQLNYQRAQQSLEALQTARAHMDGSELEISMQEAKIGEATFNAEIARLQLEDAQAPNGSSLWQASVRIEQQQLALDQLLAGPTQAQIDSAQLTLQTAQASVEDAQTALRYVQLVTPVSGTVTAINIGARDSVGQTTAAIEISDFSRLRITVPINELDIARIKEGASVVITIDAIADLTLNGQVENVGWVSSTSTDGIVTYNVQVSFETQDDRVLIGMSGEVTIDTESAA
ncbi:MAG: HlyD family efflux transporter periplasmic adaptor subunit [Chloroflexi bacterium]|nr:HlyD family efflux transporter periplasmic adaptor subunit [Chloroflexota bacterium]MCC6891829.1 HlyD family efflux transporter periplasmic adaptor subunit [Anaerolineae bacterium]